MNAGLLIFSPRVVYFLAWLVFVGNAVCQNLGESVSCAFSYIFLPYVSKHHDQIHEECNNLNENKNSCQELRKSKGAYHLSKLADGMNQPVTNGTCQLCQTEYRFWSN